MTLASRLRANLWRRFTLAVFCGAVSVAAASNAAGQSPPARRYAEGDSDRCELRVRVTGAASELFGVSEHRVVVENGKPRERIRWVRALETKAGDLSDQAQASGTFELTLDSASLPLSALGLSQLTGPGDVFASEAPYVKDTFAGGRQSLKRRASSWTFHFVSADAHDAECYPREKPRHEVRISKPFWIGRTQVPVHAYERFVAAAGLAMPPEPEGIEDFNDGWRKKSHPIVKVTWDEARSYCAWIGGRLPTEAEWEYAARGGLDGVKYPWGNGRSHDEANYWRSGGRDIWQNTAPVGSFGANGFGLYDMAGNVYEWIADWYDEEYYQHSPRTDPPGPASGRQRVVRGGAGFINPAVLRISTRLQNAPYERRLGVGFRCVLDAAR